VTDPPPERNPETVARVKRDATRRLLAIPDVVAVGIGQKVTGGRHTGEPAIKVFVREKRPAAEVPPDELVPARIDGVLTDVEIGGDPVPIAAPVDAPGVFEPPAGELPRDETVYRPVTGGAQVTTVFSSGHGTGGCLLRDTASPDAGYVLTCMHVVAAADVGTVTKGVTQIGQPSGNDSVAKCCNDVVGTYAGGAYDADNDAAVVRLNPGTTWRPEIAGIGPVTGTHELTQDDIGVPGSPYRVAKRGQLSRLTGGVVTALQATTTEADNLIVVAPNPNPAAGTRTVFFAVEGDSGSALVNAANQVVGLVFSRDDAGNAHAYPIGHVLKRLSDDTGIGLEVAVASGPDDVHTVPGGAFTELPPEIAERLAADPAERRAFTGIGNRAPAAASWFTDLVPAPYTAAFVLDDLAGSASGRRLLDLWEEHGTELRALIGRDRRVLLAWHRGGGAALMQLMLRLPGDPRRSLPETLNGRPLMDAVDAVLASLARAGSPGLRDALARARAALPDLAGLTYTEIVAALDGRAAGVEELIVDG